MKKARERLVDLAERLVWMISYQAADRLLDRLLASRAACCKPPRLDGDASLYIHVPFCRRPCKFCCFVRFPAEGHNIPRYYECLRRELETLLVVTEARFRHVHVGGGTPAIEPYELLKTIDVIRSYQKGFELTVELHPLDLLGEDGYSAIRELRADRLSIGVQSFHDEMLARLGRLSHSGREALEAARLASRLAHTVNLDLVWGVPGQSIECALDDLRIALTESGVNQVTLYPLLAARRIRHPNAFEMYERLVCEARRLGWMLATPWTLVKRCGLILEYIYDPEPRFIGAGLSSISVVGSVIYANTFSLERYEKLACSGCWSVAARTPMKPWEYVGFALINIVETGVAVYANKTLGYPMLTGTALLSNYLAGEARRAVYAALAKFRARALAAPL